MMSVGRIIIVHAINCNGEETRTVTTMVGILCYGEYFV